MRQATFTSKEVLENYYWFGDCPLCAETMKLRDFSGRIQHFYDHHGLEIVRSLPHQITFLYKQRVIR